ncbi:unnamed protein product [Arabis nemorensis]|uniref:Zinc finger GRF-type domain-containing protein n=1 Tax=Arabis nemorensis TaxID=586526 RepID=A0A565C910_9BRAS|nr:unnamed protein product [Arabis nemorensis]
MMEEEAKKKLKAAELQCKKDRVKMWQPNNLASKRRKTSMRDLTLRRPHITSFRAVPVIKTSTTADNPGRRFYGCHNHADGLYHIFKWWDDAIMEEFEEIKVVVEQQADLIRYFKSNQSQAIRDCVDKPTIRHCIQKTDIELAQLKEMIIETRYRSVEMKNVMVVCLILICVISCVCVCLGGF